MFCFLFLHPQTLERMVSNLSAAFFQIQFSFNFNNTKFDQNFKTSHTPISVQPYKVRTLCGW